MKRWLIAAAISFSASGVLAQDAAGILKLNEEKTYTPRAKGLTDLVVDLVNPQLTKQLNDQMIFGHISEAVFRVYWTAQPPRVAIEVLGMPEGFREIKDELAASMLANVEVIVPVPAASKFSTYTVKADAKNPKMLIATDTTHQQAIPEFEMVFGPGYLLERITAKKPVSLVTTDFTYKKESWSDPRSVMVRSVTKSQEGAQSVVSTVDIAYLQTAGMGLPSVMKTETKQTVVVPGKGAKPLENTVTETLFFKNYKVNTSGATKYFIGQKTKGE